MALEIREMILRTTIQDSATESGEKKENTGNSSISEPDIEHIIAECIEQIMARLREENER